MHQQDNRKTEVILRNPVGKGASLGSYDRELTENRPVVCGLTLRLARLSRRFRLVCADGQSSGAFSFLSDCFTLTKLLARFDSDYN